MKWLVVNVFARIGNTLLLFGFVSTELILTLGGLGRYYNHQILLAGSASMALGVLFLLISQNKGVEL